MGASAGRLSNDEVVVITGCSEGGIGHALAREFAAQGCRVFATARRVDAMTDLRDSGIHCLALDVTQPDSIKAALAEVLQLAGRIDVLVNNAGTGYSGPVAEVNLLGVRQLYETNVFGALAMVQAVFPHMANRRKGRIVNIGSVAGYVHRPWNGPYCSSKAALHALTDSMRMEMAPFNIKVLLVAPGFIRTNIFGKNLENMAMAGPNSHYGDYVDSQKSMAAKSVSNLRMTPVNEFAKRVVSFSLGGNSGWRLVCGYQSGLALLINWFPMWLSDYVLWSKFGKG